MEGRASRQTEGRTDMTKLMVAFHNFANAPKIYAHRYIKNGLYSGKSLDQNPLPSRLLFH